MTRVKWAEGYWFRLIADDNYDVDFGGESSSEGSRPESKDWDIVIRTRFYRDWWADYYKPWFFFRDRDYENRDLATPFRDGRNAEGDAPDLAWLPKRSVRLFWAAGRRWVWAEGGWGSWCFRQRSRLGIWGKPARDRGARSPKCRWPACIEAIRRIWRSRLICCRCRVVRDAPVERSIGRKGARSSSRSDRCLVGNRLVLNTGSAPCKILSVEYPSLCSHSRYGYWIGSAPSTKKRIFANWNSAIISFASLISIGTYLISLCLRPSLSLYYLYLYCYYLYCFIIYIRLTLSAYSLIAISTTSYTFSAKIKNSYLYPLSN